MDTTNQTSLNTFITVHKKPDHVFITSDNYHVTIMGIEGFGRWKTMYESKCDLLLVDEFQAIPREYWPVITGHHNWTACASKV